MNIVVSSYMGTYFKLLLHSNGWNIKANKNMSSMAAYTCYNIMNILLLCVCIKDWNIRTTVQVMYIWLLHWIQRYIKVNKKANWMPAHTYYNIQNVM